MSYTALYRKFRPSTFGEMVGQEHITRTIKNQIMAGRVGHAYLFNGGRGTGKTSTAKILARAINCQNPQDGEPCNQCEICKSALNGSLTDIVEMDAASNNSVEDIRNIREEVNFLPTIAKYRIYIIDEVHMLSTGAFNALLKTLEEPPAHVKFILATTEPQKLPATILSRCQRFDFKKISEDNVIKRLEIICKETNIEITEEALKLIAILSEGAMRDAISILERCIQDGEIKITEEKIKELVGIPKLEHIQKISEGILKYDVVQSLKATEEVIAEGKDLNNILWETIKYIKDILIYKTTQNLSIYNNEEIEQIKELSIQSTTERLLEIITELSELDNTMKWSAQKQIIFQTGIIKLCNKTQNLEERISKIEQQISNGNIPSKKVEQIPSIPTKKEIPEKPKVEKTQELVQKTEDKYLKNWSNIVNNLKEKGKVTLYTNLLNSKAKEINDMTIGIEFAGGLNSFGRTVIEKPENMQELTKLVSQECGKEMQIRLIEQNKTPTPKLNEVEGFVQNLDIPFNIIEE